MPQEPVTLSDNSTNEDEYESRLSELAEKAVLSEDEQFEETTLKKKKLQIKDRMQEIARRQRGASAHP
jgi:uncharacterized protein YdcH (DUF465 family)